MRRVPLGASATVVDGPRAARIARRLSRLNMLEFLLARQPCTVVETVQAVPGRTGYFRDVVVRVNLAPLAAIKDYFGACVNALS